MKKWLRKNEMLSLVNWIRNYLKKKQLLPKLFNKRLPRRPKILMNQNSCSQKSIPISRQNPLTFIQCVEPSPTSWLVIITRITHPSRNIQEIGFFLIKKESVFFFQGILLRFDDMAYYSHVGSELPPTAQDETACRMY